MFSLFAVQPLLQNAKRLDPPLAQDKQFAVDGKRPVRYLRERFGQIRKRGGNLFAGSRIKPRDAAARAFPHDSLDADSIPFPFRAKLCGDEFGELSFVQGMREHGRAEGRRIDGIRL